MSERSNRKHSLTQSGLIDAKQIEIDNRSKRADAFLKTLQKFEWML